MRKLLFAVLICSLMLVTLALAQSGRKQKKADSLPPVQGVNRPELRTEPEPEVEPEKEKKKEAPRVLMVATEMPDMSISNYYPDTARRGCMEEIRNVMKSVTLREASNQNRNDAMKTAKESDDTYVVWMQFEVDRMASASRGGFDLRYTIFEPRTGKTRGSGIGYPQQPQTRVPLPPIGIDRPEILADWAGRDVAQQVMRKLGWIK